ncbi:MAG: ParA family protein [Actinomycetota bacterium]|nr:ParA family protein [Actinomycetota bacterium]
MAATTLAIANQKGGVAKTTSTQTLGLALADRGRRVLLVDLDPQGCLTFALGLDPEACDPTLHDVMLGRVKAADAVYPLDRLDLVPTNIELAGSEVQLMARTGREHVLARALHPIRANYDVILIDCPPSLGVLTVNGLTAADEVLIPLQCETLSHRGVAQLLDTIDDVREFTNPRLRVRGVIATMYDPRVKHARDVLGDIRTRFGLEILEPPVPRTIRFAEAPGQGVSILEHAPASAGAQAYRALAEQLCADAPEARPPEAASPGAKGAM